MQIGVTNPLRKFLGWKAFPPRESDEAIFCWDAHRVEIGGRKMLVVCNAANRFAGVTAMRAADWKRLDATCLSLIEDAMLETGFTEARSTLCKSTSGAFHLGRLFQYGAKYAEGVLRPVPCSHPVSKSRF